MAETPSLTEQLQRFAGGDRTIAEAVLRAIIPDLHRIAARELSGKSDAASITPTELINELWLKDLHKGGWKVSSRQHFYAIAALAMRQVLIDAARLRSAQRRGDGTTKLSLNGAALEVPADEVDTERLVQVGILMERLEKKHPESASIVDMHYFTGFTLEEIVEITGLTFRQVRHRWERGRNWLKDQLNA